MKQQYVSREIELWYQTVCTRRHTRTHSPISWGFLPPILLFLVLETRQTSLLVEAVVRGGQGGASFLPFKPPHLHLRHQNFCHGCLPPVMGQEDSFREVGSEAKLSVSLGSNFSSSETSSFMVVFIIDLSLFIQKISVLFKVRCSTMTVFLQI